MIKFFIFVALLQGCFAPPAKLPIKEEPDPTDGLEDVVEYHRYIKEVVKVLESDPAFREKLEKANQDEIKNGNIASELELVSHHVRTQLDEIKRVELHRLKQLAGHRDQLMNNELDSDDPLHHHIHHENPHTFEVEDLKRLIVKTTNVIQEADRQRRDEFKQYELQKEFEKRDKLNHTTGDERHKLEEQYKQMDEKHKKHEKLHTPGHKQQLEEVWQEQDQMTQDFNPKTFFMLHDLDSNGLWDQDEVKALFIKELDKMYAAGAPEDDLRERVEEMERMREAVFKEMDTNRDGFIDYKEFMNQTKQKEFEKDPGWQGIDERKPYTDEELEEYVKVHYDQMQHPQGGYYPGPGNPQMHPGYQQQHPAMQQHPGQGQGHMPPQGYQQMPPQGQGQFHPGQMPQAQVHPQQMHNQMPQHGNYPQHPNDPSLNTNEIYPNQQYPPQHQQQQYQQPPQQQYQQVNSQQNSQQQPPVNSQQQPHQQQQQQQKPSPPVQAQQPKFQANQQFQAQAQQPNLNQQQKQPQQQQLQGNIPQQQSQEQVNSKSAHGDNNANVNANAVPKQGAQPPILQSNNVPR